MNIELTFGELKTALMCCTVYQSCEKCPLVAVSEDISTSCVYHLLSAAMNCINVMEKDLTDANKRADGWEYVATRHELELITLRETIDSLEGRR